MSDFWIGVFAASWFWLLVYFVAVVCWAIWGGKSRGGEMMNTEAANDRVTARYGLSITDADGISVSPGVAPSAWRGLHTHTWADPG